MHSTNALLALSALASTALSAINDTREYRLRTEVKPHQRGKKAYNNLFLYAYHTGAGLDDAAVSSNVSIAETSYLNATATSTPSAPDNHELFDLGTTYPFVGLSNSCYVVHPWCAIANTSQFMNMAVNTGQYAAWEPVRIDVGYGGNNTFASGFFINGTGFQWTSATGKNGTLSDEFGGWLVCDWWHGGKKSFPFTVAGPC